MNLEEMSNEDLMSLSAGKNGFSSEASGIIYNRYNTKVKNYIYNFTKSYEKAEDMSQDIFLKIISNPSLYKKISGSKFKSWVFTLAKNMAINELRKSENKFTNVADFSEKEFLHPSSNLSHELDKEESFEVLNSKIKNLKFSFYDVLNKEYFKEMSYEEIVKATGEKLGTIKSRINHAKKKLKKLISSEYAERRPKV